MLRKFVYLLFLCGIGCSNPIEEALKSKHPAIEKVADSIDKYEVQIIYTQVDSTETGIRFTDYKYKANPKNYFYPASTVKLPVALLAAEYVSEHPELNLDTPYSIEKDSVPHTIANDIKQIFAVSDNASFNRLYELLGRDYINARLEKIGLENTRIAHRLSTPNATENTRRKIAFYPSYEGPIFIPDTTPDKSIKPLKVKHALKGKGFLKEGKLVTSPIDFSLKNSFPIEDQHQIMKQLFFPDHFKEKNRINLYRLEGIRIKNMMSKVPRAQGYDSANYNDSYVKFFMYGDTKDTIPSYIKIHNKVGYAYGTLTETAYIVDEKEKISFLLSATILVNNNEIFNDDTYEYDELGIPFLAQLGRLFYQYSLDHKESDL